MFLMYQLFQLNAEKSPFQRTYATQVYMFYISYHGIYLHCGCHPGAACFCAYYFTLEFNLEGMKKLNESKFMQFHHNVFSMFWGLESVTTFGVTKKLGKKS